MPDPHQPPRLEVCRISKQFPGVRALNQVDLHVRPGEVLALIGENGAGKSTLMKILAGVQAPDSGEIRMDGKKVRIDSVERALELGISLIHQELNLADNLDVASNIFLGREPRRFGFVRKREMAHQSRRLLEMVGLQVEPDTIAGDLSIGQQQMVEIAKALSADARVLIMDEPTSSLSHGETETLLDVIDQLRQRNVSIIYISHRLREVQRIADRVAVLRDGENAGLLCKDAIHHDAMVRLMIGRDISQFYARQPHERGDPVLVVDQLRTMAHPQHELSFSVHAGELVGVAGLVGAGRTEVLQALFGIQPPLSGRASVNGHPITMRSSRQAVEAGMALIPEDRKQHGLIVDMAVDQNLSLAGLRRERRLGGLLNFTAEQRQTTDMIRQLTIRTPNHHQLARYLSGGNQQKIVIGKWLALEPKVLLLDEPTRGIDIGAKQEIYRLMESLAKRGVAVLFVSSELEEILGMSDRVLVMHEGAITGQLPRDQLSEESIMMLATGRTSDAPTEGSIFP